MFLCEDQIPNVDCTAHMSVGLHKYAARMHMLKPGLLEQGSHFTLSILRRGDPTNPALRKEPSQINVILQQKLLAAKLNAVCTVYKQ